MKILDLTPEQIKQEINRIHPQSPVSSRGFYLLTIHIREMNIQDGRILRQEMIDLGGEAVLSTQDNEKQNEACSILLIGREKHFTLLNQMLLRQNRNTLQKIGSILKQDLDHFYKQPPAISWGKKTLDFSNPMLMGILNITPDSFYDGGQFLDPESALQRTRIMLDQGAVIIDIGAESSRPGASGLDEDTEMSRIVPLVEKIRAQFPDAILSIDTVKAGVAHAALQAGADIINDIQGLRDPEMCKVAALHGCPVILMHMQGEPATMQNSPQYEDVVEEIFQFFQKQIVFAQQNGIDSSRIILDPGIGFGKTLQHNLQIIKELSAFKVLNRPILIGLSRKSMIGALTGNQVPQNRLAGTLAADMAAVQNGASILRVHDVEEHMQMLQIYKNL